MMNDNCIQAVTLNESDFALSFRFKEAGDMDPFNCQIIRVHTLPGIWDDGCQEDLVLTTK